MGDYLAASKTELDAKKVILIGVSVTTVCVLIIIALSMLALNSVISFTVFNFISFVVILISLLAAVLWADKTVDFMKSAK